MTAILQIWNTRTSVGGRRVSKERMPDAAVYPLELQVEDSFLQ